MEIRYLIAKSPQGYNVKYDTSLEPPMIQEELARRLSYPILHKGEISDPNEVKIIEDFVRQANQEGDFDSEALEKILAENRRDEEEGK